MASSLLAVLFAGGSVVASAQSASGNAHDLSVAVNVPLVGNLDVAPQAKVAFVGETTEFADAAEVLSLDTGPGPLRLRTGVTSAETVWVPAGYLVAASRASVANVDLTVLGLLGVNLISLRADAAVSRAVVGGECPAQEDPTTNEIPGVVVGRIYASGFDGGGLGPIPGDGNPGDPGGPGGGAEHDVQLPGLSIGLIGIDIPLPLEFPANTNVDLNVLGLAQATLILNEEIRGGDGVNTVSLARNALHLNLNALGLITADVILAHSEASIDCTK